MPQKRRRIQGHRIDGGMLTIVRNVDSQTLAYPGSNGT